MATVESFARRAATLPAVLVDSTPPAVTAGAEVLEREARANLLRASGGDLRLSRARSIRAARTGGAGSKVDVRVKLIGAGKRATAHVLPVGPVSLVEGPTRRHRIPFAHGQGRRYATAGEAYSERSNLAGFTARRKRAARTGFVWIPGVGFRTRVNHPGTRGKRPVRRAMDTHSEEAGRAGLEVFATAVQRHLSRG